MNVIELLENELKNKNWTLEEKQRYIYLRSCQIFSFDPKYNLSLLLPNFFELQQEFRNKTIDLTNITDYNVVCTSYSKYVINVLLEELLNIKTTFEGTDHNYITSQVIGKKYKIDATMNDIYRVKLNLDTRGYQLLPENENYDEELMKIDQKIGYIKNKYENCNIKNNKNDIANFPSYIKNEIDYFNYVMNELKKIYQTYNVSHNFSDAKFCIDYLIRNLFYTYEQEYIKDVTMFLNNSKDWDIVKIYAINLEGEMLYWGLEKERENYSFHEIPRSRAKYYTKYMKGLNKEYII